MKPPRAAAGANRSLAAVPVLHSDNAIAWDFFSADAQHHSTAMTREEKQTRAKGGKTDEMLKRVSVEAR